MLDRHHAVAAPSELRREARDASRPTALLDFRPVVRNREALAYIVAYCVIMPFGGALFSQSFSFSRAYYDVHDPSRAEFMMSVLRTVFALAWVSGSGFALGAGSQAGALATAVGPLPSIPVLAAIPAGPLDYGVVALVVPVLAMFYGSVQTDLISPDREFSLHAVERVYTTLPFLRTLGGTLLLSATIAAISAVVGAASTAGRRSWRSPMSRID
jgi:hypothetical protein